MSDTFKRLNIAVDKGGASNNRRLQPGDRDRASKRKLQAGEKGGKRKFGYIIKIFLKIENQILIQIVSNFFFITSS